MKIPTKPLTVRLRSEVHSDILKRAAALQVDRSDVARQLIFDGLNHSDHLGTLGAKLAEVSERLLVLTQEIQRLHQQSEKTQRWVNASTPVFMSYAEGISLEEAKAKWNQIKERR